MAAPNDPTPPKKPNPQGVQANKPGVKPPAGKPQSVTNKPSATTGKPSAKAGNGKPAAKPTKEKRSSGKGASVGGKRRFGHVLVDLGFLDDDQLWEVLEEAKNTA